MKIKTIKNHRKYPSCERIPMLLEKALRSAGTHFFMRLQKEQQTDNKKNSIITWQKTISKQ